MAVRPFPSAAPALQYVLSYVLSQRRPAVIISGINSVVRPTPGWLKVLWSRDNTPGISDLGMARVGYVPLGAYHRIPLSSVRYSPSPEPDSSNMGSSVASRF